MRTPRWAATLAASSESRPVGRWSSVSRLIAADEYEPGGTGLKSGLGLSAGLGGISRAPVICDRSMPASGKIVASDRTMPLPMAVQAPTLSRDDVNAAIDRFQLQRGTAIGSGAGERDDGDLDVARQLGDEALGCLL